jgi:putative transposase
VLQDCSARWAPSATRSTTRSPKASSETLRLELLDREHWNTRQQLATAIFDYIEAFYNRTRRHSSIGMLSPIDYEGLHSPVAAAA